jgi:hypothetical protein
MDLNNRMDNFVDDQVIAEQLVTGVRSILLTPEEAAAFDVWKTRLILLIPAYVVMWTALHVISVLFAHIFGDKSSSLSKKDKYIWHNKCV